MAVLAVVVLSMLVVAQPAQACSRCHHQRYYSDCDPCGWYSYGHYPYHYCYSDYYRHHWHDYDCSDRYYDCWPRHHVVVHHYYHGGWCW